MEKSTDDSYPALLAKTFGVPSDIIAIQGLKSGDRKLKYIETRYESTILKNRMRESEKWAVRALSQSIPNLTRVGFTPKGKATKVSSVTLHYTKNF